MEIRKLVAVGWTSFVRLPFCLPEGGREKERVHAFDGTHSHTHTHTNTLTQKKENKRVEI